MGQPKYLIQPSHLSVHAAACVKLHCFITFNALQGIITAGALVAAAPILGSISVPPGVRVGPGLGVVVIRTPFQTKFQPAWFRASVVLNYSCYVVLGLNRPRR